MTLIPINIFRPHRRRCRRQAPVAAQLVESTECRLLLSAVAMTAAVDDSIDEIETVSAQGNTGIRSQFQFRGRPASESPATAGQFRALLRNNRPPVTLAQLQQLRDFRERAADASQSSGNAGMRQIETTATSRRPEGRQPVLLSDLPRAVVRENNAETPLRRTLNDTTPSPRIQTLQGRVGNIVRQATEDRQAGRVIPQTDIAGLRSIVNTAVAVRPTGISIPVILRTPQGTGRAILNPAELLRDRTEGQPSVRDSQSRPGRLLVVSAIQLSGRVTTESQPSPIFVAGTQSQTAAMPVFVPIVSSESDSDRPSPIIQLTDPADIANASKPSTGFIDIGSQPARLTPADDERDSDVATKVGETIEDVPKSPEDDMPEPEQLLVEFLAAQGESGGFIAMIDLPGIPGGPETPSIPGRAPAGPLTPQTAMGRHIAFESAGPEAAPAVQPAVLKEDEAEQSATTYKTASMATTAAIAILIGGTASRLPVAKSLRDHPRRQRPLSKR